MHKYLANLFIFLDKYNKEVFKKINANIGIIYRNYELDGNDSELFQIAKACKRRRFQLFVSNNIKLALKVNATGIYIPSFNKKDKFSNLEKKNFVIIGSAHNQKEIHQKISQKCTAIFLSPLFFVKKRKNFLGIHKFNNLSNYNKINIIALGGINSKNIKKLKLLNISGFGGIGLFKKKPAFKRPVFLKNNFFI